MLAKSSIAAFVVLGLAPGLAAQQLHVPGDYPTVQLAIDNCPPGGTILIHGGTHGPVTVDQPMTLIGDGSPLFVNNGVAATAMTAQAPITLSGPGSGKVILAYLNVAGTVDGTLFSFSQAGIQGSGFDELHVIHANVAGPQWTLLTGVAEGAPALSTDIPWVLVSYSLLTGAYSDSDDCYGSGPAGPAGLEAPTSSVILLDSSIVGGGSNSICAYGYCPTGGEGGPGLVANELFVADSLLKGGLGAFYYDMDAPSAPCGKAPDGVPSLVSVQHDLGSGVQATTPLLLGAPWTLSWTAQGSHSWIAIYPEAGLEPLFKAAGILFVGPGWPRTTAYYPGAGFRQYSVPIPVDPVLWGFELTAQVLDVGGMGLTRPITDLIGNSPPTAAP